MRLPHACQKRRKGCIPARCPPTTHTRSWRLAAWLATSRIAHLQLLLLQPRAVAVFAPPRQALLHSQSGPHAGAWLTAIPGDVMTLLPPQSMPVAVHRRLWLPLPVIARGCGPSLGCGMSGDAFIDHASACPCSGLLAKRAWILVARQAINPEAASCSPC